MKNFLALLLTFFVLYTSNAQFPNTTGDSQGVIGINTIKIANEVLRPCDPVGPCYYCPTLVNSDCNAINIEIETFISALSFSTVSASISVDYSPYSTPKLDKYPLRI